MGKEKACMEPIIVPNFRERYTWNLVLPNFGERYTWNLKSCLTLGIGLDRFNAAARGHHCYALCIPKVHSTSLPRPAYGIIASITLLNIMAPFPNTVLLIDIRSDSS